MNCKNCIEICNCCSGKNSEICGKCKPFGVNFNKTYRTNPKCTWSHNNKHRFKPGDKVTVKNSLLLNDVYNGCYVVGDMISLAGKQVKIIQTSDFGRYRITNSDWYWDDEMFE